MPLPSIRLATPSPICISLIAFGSLTAAALPLHAADDDAATVRKLSQAFSDASASGDAAALARMLDDRVLFMNEGGDIATKKDIVDSAQPPPAGTKNSLTQADLKAELHGNVAVTSFADLQTLDFHGQTLHAKFLSTEVWLKQGGSWKLISSQTMAAQDDPPAVTLPDATLDEYVGRYVAGSDYVYRIERHDHTLTASANGSKPIELKAELRDVLFVPGQPRVRRLFQRDAQGHVTGFISRREGHDIVLRKVS